MMAACHYCGERSEKSLHRDHFVPKSRGGSDTAKNLVPACGVCNSIKGSKFFNEVRLQLIQKRLGWPRFSIQQLHWLREQDFDLSELYSAKLAFEELGHEIDNERQAISRRHQSSWVNPKRSGRIPRG